MIVGLVILATSWWVIDSGRVSIGAGEPVVGRSADATLPECPTRKHDVLVPVQDQWSQVVNSYFAQRGETVTDVYQWAFVRDLREQLAGWHRCWNTAAAVEGGWQGSVPRGSVAGVLLTITLQPPAGQSSNGSLVVTIANNGAKWRVVEVASSP